MGMRQTGQRWLATLMLMGAMGLGAGELHAAQAVGSDAAADKPAAKKAVKAEKAGKSAASKAEKPEAADKADKADKTDKIDKAEKPAAKGAIKELPIEEAAATPVGDDAAKLGPFQAPPRAFPFPLLGDDRAREVFVDRAGNLYKERPYQGNVPDWNEAPSAALGGRCKVEAQNLSWVGFQNNADGSRVYVQLEKNACGYVYRPDDLHVVIDLPQVSISSENLRREILTGAFPTAVEMVKAEDLGGKGTRVVIVLRERRPYLSAHLGRYLFVDVTR
jgi:hypothetical protein